MKKIKSPPNRRMLTGHEFAEMKKLDTLIPITDMTDIPTDGHSIEEPTVEAAEYPIVETKNETPAEEIETEIQDPVYQIPSQPDVKIEGDETPEDVLEIKDPDHLKAKSGFWGSFKKEPRSTQSSSDLPDHSEHATLAERPTPMIQQNTNKVEIADAVVSQTMTIKGDVDLDASLLVAGKIFGNVACNKHLETKPGSLIEGDIKAQVANLFGGEIKGNVTCEENLSIDEVTVVHGDLAGKVVNISGTVTGNITAVESVILSKTATVKGNLISASISVEAGAVLEGQYTVRKNIN